MEASEKFSLDLMAYEPNCAALDSKADTQRLHDGGRSAAHIAAEYGDVDRLMLLAKHGVDINQRNWLEESPLHRAAACGIPGAEDAVRFLCEQHIDINAPNIRGETALHKAVQFNQIAIVKLLLEAGADPSIQDQKGQMPENLSTALAPESTINMAKVFSSWRAQKAVSSVLTRVRPSV